jgi:hypothetical protein
MAILTGQNIGANQKGILNLGSTINTPLDTTLRNVTDGLGNNSPLQLSTSIVGITNDLHITNTMRIRNALDSSQSIVFSGTLIYNESTRHDFNVGGTTRLNLTATGLAIGNGTTTASARLHVRGDGTNPVARFENTSGSYALLINSLGDTLYSSGNFINIRGNLAGGAGVSVSLGSFNSLNATSGTQWVAETIGTFTGNAGNGNKYLHNFAYTINNAGAQTGTATGIFLNATETALNGMTHNLLDLQVGGVSKFRVSSNGTLTIPNNNIIVSNGYISSSQLYALTIGKVGNYFIDSASDGVVRISDNAQTSFGRLQFGGTTNAFPAIKRSSAAIDFRLADDSGYCAITASNVIMSSGSVLESLGNVVNLKSNLAGGSGFVLDIQSRNVLSGSNVEQGALTINVTKANTTVGTANFRLSNLLYTINNTAAQTGNATGILLNATETALNGMTHNLMDLQVGGSSRAKITNAGRLDLLGDLFAPVIWATNGVFRGNNTGTRITTTVDGIWLMQDNAGTSFNRLQFGGTTSSFPAIKRNGAAIDFRLADDSADCAIKSLSLNTSFVYLNGNDVYLTGAAFYKGSTANSRFNIFTSGYSIEIGATSAIAASAILDLKSTTQGFLPPRMTTTQVNAIASPAEGLVVFNTTISHLCVYQGGAWVKINHSPM